MRSRVIFLAPLRRSHASARAAREPCPAHGSAQVSSSAEWLDEACPSNAVHKGESHPPFTCDKPQARGKGGWSCVVSLIAGSWRSITVFPHIRDASCSSPRRINHDFLPPFENDKIRFESAALPACQPKSRVPLGFRGSGLQNPTLIRLPQVQQVPAAVGVPIAFFSSRFHAGQTSCPGVPPGPLGKGLGGRKRQFITSKGALQALGGANCFLPLFVSLQMLYWTCMSFDFKAYSRSGWAGTGTEQAGRACNHFTRT